jgi:competence protein ComEC
METGTAHLLAISGLHIGIVALVLALGMRLLLVERKRAALIVAAFTVFYALLTDARTPAIRATILVVMLSAAYWVGRRRPGFNSLAAAGLVVLALSPADLFRTGTQLSFLAVSALVFSAPHWLGSAREHDALDRLVEKTQAWPRRMLGLGFRFARDLALVSVTVWLFTLPLVMARFHLVSPAALILNVVLWVPMAVALAAGFGVLALGWLAPMVAGLFAWVCDQTLWILQSTIQTVREAPLSHFWVPGPNDWWLAGCYGGLALLAAMPQIRPPKRWLLASICVWSSIGLAVPLVRSTQERMGCTFLSVGHGSAVVLELPSGQTMLYDAGQFAAPERGSRLIASSLWYLGKTHIDAVVLSHSDADHYNALPGLLERFSVGIVYVSPVMFEEESEALNALRLAIKESHVPLREIRAGQRLQGGRRCRIEVLHPPRRGSLGTDNANCIVLSVEYLGFRILLPGDLEPPGLYDVMAEEPWDCDILMAPHHGSPHSDPPGLAAWCRPEWVVISGSHQSDLQATTESYTKRGAEILHTAQVGAVHLEIRSGEKRIQSFSKRERERLGEPASRSPLSQ